ncbi:GIY-YIG nuclease family protein [Candidatus Kaiserbacteria bacterium]|nr:GIY-YIG nuclease family protein [Candidatus Kaiserbacteria bacterium]MCB9811314.1 GIY-YIG nuclease family protein [Candidatus Nomurabacteria bacterium]
MSYYVYILRCADNTLYTGITNDLAARVTAHNEGKTAAKYTRARRPVVLVYREQAADRSSALRREHSIKALDRQSKELLIKTGDC